MFVVQKKCCGLQWASGTYGVVHGKECVYMDKQEKGRRTHCHSVSAAVPKLCSANPKESFNNSQQIRLCISVVAALKSAFLKLKE
jgi:hypothetical protein